MSGWDKIDTSGGAVTCFKRYEENSSIAYFKCELFLDKPPSDAARYTFDNWIEINRELASSELEHIERLGAQGNDVIAYFGRAKPQGPVSGREAHIASVFLELQDNTFSIISTSVDTGLPPKEGYVIADLKLSLHTFEPIADDVTRTHYTNIL